MRVRQLVVGVSAALAIGCATSIVLTGGGTAVQKVDRAQLPDGCRVVGDVSIGVPPDAAHPETEADLFILMRNKAAEMGADHIVVERSELRPESGGRGHYVGSASAYVCGATSGGEHAAPHDPDEGGGGGAGAAAGAAGGTPAASSDETVP